MTRRWWVVTPEFPYTEVISWEIGGPTYDIHDVIEVEATTRREAILVGVNAMLADQSRFSWVHYRRSDKMNPFAGVKAYLDGEGE